MNISLLKEYGKCISIAVTLIFSLSLFAISQENQNPETKNQPTQSDSTEIKRVTDFEEFVLETIRIEAVVEKPSVTLIPKRIETDVGDIPFGNRSFDRELKKMPKIISSYGRELENAKRIKKLKKMLDKESK